MVVAAEMGSIQHYIIIFSHFLKPLLFPETHKAGFGFKMLKESII